VLYGTSPSNLNASVSVSGAATTSKVIANLTAGTHYFAVVVVNNAGIESAPSNPVSAVVP